MALLLSLAAMVSVLSAIQAGEPCESGRLEMKSMKRVSDTSEALLAPSIQALGFYSLTNERRSERPVYKAASGDATVWYCECATFQGWVVSTGKGVCPTDGTGDGFALPATAPDDWLVCAPSIAFSPQHVTGLWVAYKPYVTNPSVTPNIKVVQGIVLTCAPFSLAPTPSPTTAPTAATPTPPPTRPLNKPRVCNALRFRWAACESGGVRTAHDANGVATQAGGVRERQCQAIHGCLHRRFQRLEVTSSQASEIASLGAIAAGDKARADAMTASVGGTLAAVAGGVYNAKASRTAMQNAMESAAQEQATADKQLAEVRSAVHGQMAMMRGEAFPAYALLPAPTSAEATAKASASAASASAPRVATSASRVAGLIPTKGVLPSAATSAAIATSLHQAAADATSNPTSSASATGAGAGNIALVEESAAWCDALAATFGELPLQAPTPVTPAPTTTGPPSAAPWVPDWGEGRRRRMAEMEEGGRAQVAVGAKGAAKGRAPAGLYLYYDYESRGWSLGPQLGLSAHRLVLDVNYNSGVADAAAKRRAALYSRLDQTRMKTEHSMTGVRRIVWSIVRQGYVE
jgi:hypothetical protein